MISGREGEYPKSSGGEYLQSSGERGGEVAVISHLLEVERQAQSLISEAEAEADKRAAEYKAKAESEFKAAHDALIVEMDKAYKEQVEAIKKAHDEEIAAYKRSIEALPQNREAFNALVRSLAGAGA